jgi:hypothetical protein
MNELNGLAALDPRARAKLLALEERWRADRVVVDDVNARVRDLCDTIGRAESELRWSTQRLAAGFPPVVTHDRAYVGGPPRPVRIPVDARAAAAANIGAQEEKIAQLRGELGRLEARAAALSQRIKSHGRLLQRVREHLGIPRSVRLRAVA